MLRAACHCTAVRLEIARAPDWVFDCNCTLCRRYGALWAHYRRGEIALVQGAESLERYAWAKRQYAFCRCTHCGCVTHFTVAGQDYIGSVNVRAIPAIDPTSVKLQHTDNAHTGFFWTRAPDAFQPGEQAAPETDGWR